MQDDHLWPPESPFSDPAFSQGYTLVVARALLGESIPKVHATVACLPAFEPEWALRIQSEDETQFTLTLAEADSQIWPHGQQVSVTTHDCVLPTEFADGMFRTWRRMLEGTRYGPRRTLALDGNSYHFAARIPSAPAMAGFALDANRNSPNGKMISLCETLKQYALASQLERADLMQSARAHIDWFDTMPHTPAPGQEEFGKLLKRLRKHVQHYRDGITTKEELVFQIGDRLDDVHYPPLLEMVEIIDVIPLDIRQQLHGDETGRGNPNA